MKEPENLLASREVRGLPDVISKCGVIHLYKLSTTIAIIYNAQKVPFPGNLFSGVY